MKARSAGGFAEKILIGFVAAFIVVAVLLGLFLLQSWLLMLAWNAVGHGVFHGPAVAYWQAMWGAVLLNMIGAAFKAMGSSKS